MKKTILIIQYGGYIKTHIRIDPSEDFLDDESPKDTLIKNTLYKRKLVFQDESKSMVHIFKIYKDGNYLQDLKVEHINPIDEKHIVKEAVNYVNKIKHIFKQFIILSLTWENAILENNFK